MKTKNCRAPLKSAAMLAGAICAALPLQAFAAPIVTATLTAPSIITSGDPVVLKFTIVNPAPDHSVSVYLGNHDSAFYTLGVSHWTINETVGADLTSGISPTGNAKAVPVYTIAPGSSLTKYLVLTSAFAEDELLKNSSGLDYAVNFQVTLPYASTPEPLIEEYYADQRAHEQAVRQIAARNAAAKAKGELETYMLGNEEGFSSGFGASTKTLKQDFTFKIGVEPKVNTFRARVAPVISATLETPATTSQGEPIALKCAISNPDNNAPVSVYLGDHDRGFYTLFLTDATSGKPVAARIVPTIYIPSPIGQMSVHTIQPRASLTEHIVVTQNIRNIQPGSYIIHLHTVLGYAAQTEPLELESIHDQDTFYRTHAVFNDPEITHERANAIDPQVTLSLQEKADAPDTRVQDVAFHIIVKPRDIAALKATAKQLASELADNHSGSSQDTQEWMREELFSMPADAAAGAWSYLPHNDWSWQHEVISELKQYPSIQGADLLASIMDDQSAGSNRQMAGDSLSFYVRQMRTRIGDADLYQSPGRPAQPEDCQFRHYATRHRLDLTSISFHR